MLWSAFVLWAEILLPFPWLILSVSTCLLAVPQPHGMFLPRGHCMCDSHYPESSSLTNAQVTPCSLLPDLYSKLPFQEGLHRPLTGISQPTPSLPHVSCIPQHHLYLMFPVSLPYLYFPDSSAGKESAWNLGDPGSIPGLGRSAGEGRGYLLPSILGLPWWLSW